TGVGGFAIRCITILLLGLKRKMLHLNIKRILISRETCISLASNPLNLKGFFQFLAQEWTQFCTGSHAMSRTRRK
ncbi:hypothetical protein, partial [Pseudomonas syringae]|uniref:hypothetical protein n=1 Tax=Pseudomonas syringae TaxID=317 RepID=UPI001F083A35